MNDFLLEHSSFAGSAFLVLFLGTVLAACWALGFRRLVRAGAAPGELLWEARGGAFCGLAWRVLRGGEVKR